MPNTVLRFGRELLRIDGNRDHEIIVMAVGGWSSFEAIEPYLISTSEDGVSDEFDRISVARPY